MLSGVPSGKLTYLWKILKKKNTMVYGKIKYKLQFSTAMLVCQRVTTTSTTTAAEVGTSQSEWNSAEKAADATSPGVNKSTAVNG